MLHPSEFFKWCAVRVGIDTYELISENLRQKLINIHPKNFIKSRITLPIYELTVSYETKHGNYKKLKKYMIGDSVEEDEFSDVWMDIFIRDYQEKYKNSIKNIKILNAKHIADAVLQIG